MVALFGVVGALKAATAGVLVDPALLATAAMRRAPGVALNNTPHPLVDVRLLRDRAYATAVVVNAVSSFLLVGAMFYLTQYLQVVLGISPVNAGLLLVPGMVASMAATMITGELVGKLSARPLLLVAITLAAAGLAMHVVEASGVWPAISSGTGAAVWFGASFMVLGVGAGMIDPVTNTIILGSAPPEQSGAASALSETGYELGGAFGPRSWGGAGTYSRQLSTVDLPSTPPSPPSCRTTSTRLTCSRNPCPRILPRPSSTWRTRRSRPAWGGRRRWRWVAASQRR